MRMRSGKTRIPPAASFRRRSGQIGRVFDVGTKTGRTDHSAIGTGQASRSGLVPSGTFKLAVEEFLNMGRVQGFRHHCRCPVLPLRRLLKFLLGGLRERYRLHQRRSAIRPYFDYKIMPVRIRYLRHRQIKPIARARTRIHRSTKTIAPGLSTLHDNHEQLIAPKRIIGIGIRFIDKNFILDMYRLEFARPNAKKSIAW